MCFSFVGTTKNWIALEDSYNKNGASLASTVICNSNTAEDRNVFAIYVSYYVKVKLSVSAMGGELSLKLPFVLAHSCREEEPVSPNANIHMEGITDSIVTDNDDSILKNSKNPLIKYETKDLSSPKEFEDMQMGNVIIESENSQPGKVIVNVEGHMPTINIDKSAPSNSEKANASPKKAHTEDDMNLITNYDSDST